MNEIKSSILQSTSRNKMNEQYTACLVDLLNHELEKVSKTEPISPVTPVLCALNRPDLIIYLQSGHVCAFIILIQTSNTENIFSTKIKKALLYIRGPWSVRWQQNPLYVEIKNICIGVDNVLFGTLYVVSFVFPFIICCHGFWLVLHLCPVNYLVSNLSILVSVSSFLSVWKLVSSSPIDFQSVILLICDKKSFCEC